MKICTNCGAQLPDAAVFCTKCGTSCANNNPVGGKQLGSDVGEFDATQNGIQPGVPGMPVNPGMPGGQGVYPPPKKSGNTAIIIIIIVLVVVLFISGGVLGFVLLHGRSKAPDVDPTTTTSDYSTTNSGETTTEEPGVTSTPLSDADSELQSIMDNSSAGTDALFIMDEHGNSLEYGDTSGSMSASALVLFPVLYAYSVDIDNGITSPNDKVEVIYISDGRGKLTKKDAGKYLTIRELFEYAFEYSDNNAINSLMNYYGFDGIETECHNGGFDSVVIGKYVGPDPVDGYDNFVSAEDMTRMVKSMYLDNGFASEIICNRGIVNDENGDIGMGSSIGYPLCCLNGYTGSIYNEVLVVELNGEIHIATYISKSKEAKSGSATARKIGACLSKWE